MRLTAGRRLLVVVQAQVAQRLVDGGADERIAAVGAHDVGALSLATTHHFAALIVPLLGSGTTLEFGSISSGVNASMRDIVPHET
jgi:hypothetical protein